MCNLVVTTRSSGRCGSRSPGFIDSAQPYKHLQTFLSKKVNLPNIRSPGAGSGRAGTERGAVADGISLIYIGETHGHFLRNTNFLGCS